MILMYYANSRSAMNAYRSIGVESIIESASPQRLVQLLFDGARAAVASAALHLQRGEVPAKCEAIAKAIAIVDGGLKASLDLNVGGKMAQNLSDLYVYMTQRLLEANLKNDAKALDEVAQLLLQLGSAWEGIADTPARSAPTVRSAPEPTPIMMPPRSSPAPIVSMQSRRLASAYGAF
jgi:flagellar protein FliS